MRKLLLTIMFSIAIFMVWGQEWIKPVANKVGTKTEMNFYDIQKAFYSYYEPLNAVDGKYDLNGQQVKIPGWKQFKRWEWFWESRIDRATGTINSTPEIDAIYSQHRLNSVKGTTGNWTAMGPKSSTGGYAGIGRLNCVAFHPTDNNVFWVGSPSGGLWKTADGGATWTVLTDQNAVLGVSDIAIPSDYATSKTLYIATGDRDGGSMWSLGGGGSADNNSIGVLKSTDDGATWLSTGLTYTVSNKMRIGRLLIHPTDNSILFAATSDGIQKTVNGGVNWTKVYTYSRQYLGDLIIDMEFKPGDATVMYASTKEYGLAPKILKSTNSGSTWTSIKDFATSDNRVEIAVTANGPEYIYAIVSTTGSALSGIFRSTDGGANFTQPVTGGDANKSYLGYYSDGSGDNSGQGNYDLCIAASPIDKNVALIGGINTWKTADGGTSWAICNMWTSYSGYNKVGAPVAHADKHALAYRADGTLFECNDGGIYKSTNHGTSWADISNGMTISQLYRLSVSQTNAGMVITGLQDNGSKLYNSNSWTDVTGGDGMECLIDYTNANTQYATYTNGTIYRTTNLWSTDVTISDNIGGGLTGSWVTPYIIDPNNNSTLYVGYADVWKTTDKGNNFTKISTINSGSKLRSMAIAPSNSNYLYVADFSHIWKTTNGGTTWTDMTGTTLPVSSNSITYIAVKNDNPETIWVTMGGYNDQKVYQSTNGGTTWTSISAGLPSLPVMSIVQNKQAVGQVQLFVGTDVGVYVKNGTDNWELFSQGLPNVVVTELEIYYDTVIPANSKLRAATSGRGLWESDLYSEPLAPAANFTASKTTVSLGEIVTFTDASLNQPTSWAWTFTGGIPTTSTEQNPQVIYNALGTFDVTLTVTNGLGSNSITKTEYINAIELPDYPAPTNLQASVDGYAVTLNWDKPHLDTLINEGFEGAWPPQGWSVAYSSTIDGEQTNPTGATWTQCDANTFPTDGAQYIHGGTYSAALGYDAPEYNWLISPEIMVSQRTKLNFWLWYYSDATYITKFHVLVKNSGVWDTLNTHGAGSDINEYQKAVELSLNAYAGKTVQIAFVYEYTDGYQLAIDDVFVGSILSKYQIYRNNELITIVDSTAIEYTDVALIPGNYDYYLKAGYTNPEMYSEASNHAIVDVFAVAAAEFTADVTSGEEPLEVNFTNLSTNADTYLWDFGDGNTGADLNPGHTYTQAGKYSVSLQASNLHNSDTLTKVNYITVTMKRVTADFDADIKEGTFPLEVTFTNKSINATTYSWNFGDGAISVESNPVHIYTKNGSYTVALTAANSNFSDSNLKTNYITVNWGAPVAEFEAAPVSGIDPLVVTFTDKSEYAESWNWSFGDGSESTEQSPVHSFSEGVYTITLEVTNPTGSNSITKQNLIIVNINSIADVTKYNLKVYPNPVDRYFDVELRNDNFKSVALWLYDSSGKLLIELNPTMDRLIKQSIDMQRFEAGSYILKIVIDNETIIVNIVKQ